MTNNNRRKMKRKKPSRKPEVFWNPNNKNSFALKKVVKRKGKPRKKIKTNSFGLIKMPKVRKVKRKVTRKKSLVPRNKFALTPSKTSILGFLNNAVPKQQELDREPMKLFVPVPMTPSTIFRKETIFDKDLKPWGDVDMDGSLNHMDCDPRDVSQDGFFSNIAGAIKRTVLGPSKEDERSDDRERVSKYAAKESGVREILKEEKDARTAYGQLARERAKKEARGKNYNLSETQLKRIGDAARDEKKKLQEQGRTIKFKRSGIISGEGEGTAYVKKKTVLDSIANVGRSLVKDIPTALESSGSRQIKNLNLQIAKREAWNKTHTIAEQKPVTQLMAQRDKIKSRIISKKTEMVSGVLSAFTPLGAVPEIRSTAAGARVSRTKKGKRGRGRPAGTYKGGYTVDGVTISEAQFQQVRSAENKRRKAMSLPKVHLGARQFDTAKQAVQRQEVGQAVPQQEQGMVYEEQPQPEQQYSEGRTVQVQPQQPQQQGTVQQMQEQEQMNDNILHAPSITNGELQQTAGVFQDDPQYNILNAPNFQKGGLRNVGNTEETPAVQLGERPNANPYGNEYTEIEPGTGRVLVKRRPQEKWATGEAL